MEIQENNSSTIEVQSLRMAEESLSRMDETPTVNESDTSLDNQSESQFTEMNKHLQSNSITYTKHSSNEFECTINNCGRVVKTLRSLFKHMETHQDKSTYKYACEEPGCEKRFLKKYSLELHTRVHMNVRPFSCSMCTKSFRGSGDLERHSRIHTGVKPYKCCFQNCDKSYSQPENLRVHVRRHTGDRPFVCTHPGCEKDFYCKSNLIAHLRIHQGIRPYVCEICSMAFTENSSLYKHRKIHLKKQLLKENEVVGCNDSTICSVQTTESTPKENDDIIHVQIIEPSSTTYQLVQTSESSPDEEPTTIIFIMPNELEETSEEHVNNAILLASIVEPDITEDSSTTDALESTGNSENPVNEAIEAGVTDKIFYSDVDRSADLGLDRITHQPDASITVGLDEFMNSLRQDNVPPEYFNGEISFI